MGEQMNETRVDGLRYVYGVDVDVALANRDAEIERLQAELAGVIEGHKASVAMWEQQDYSNYTEIAALRQQVAELQAWKARVPIVPLKRQYSKIPMGTADYGLDALDVAEWLDKLR